MVVIAQLASGFVRLRKKFKNEYFMLINMINFKRAFLVAFMASLFLGIIAKIFYFDKKKINYLANEINYVEISLKNKISLLDSKKYVCIDFKQDSFVNNLNNFEKDYLPENNYLIGTISFYFKSAESIKGQIFSFKNKIYLKIKKDVYSGSIDLNSYFKDLNLIFGKFSTEEIKTIILKIKKSEVNPYFMDGGDYWPIENRINEVFDALKNCKLHPMWSLMSYGDFIILKKSGEKHEGMLLHYENNLFFVFDDAYYFIDNKILDLFEESKI